MRNKLPPWASCVSFKIYKLILHLNNGCSPNLCLFVWGIADLSQKSNLPRQVWWSGGSHMSPVDDSFLFLNEIQMKPLTVHWTLISKEKVCFTEGFEISVLLVDSFILWLPEWLAADWLIDWLIDWLTDWLTYRLTDWLIDWLIDLPSFNWLTHWLTDERTD